MKKLWLLFLLPLSTQVFADEECFNLHDRKEAGIFFKNLCYNQEDFGWNDEIKHFVDSNIEELNNSSCYLTRDEKEKLVKIRKKYNKITNQIKITVMNPYGSMTDKLKALDEWERTCRIIPNSLQEQEEIDNYQ